MKNKLVFPENANFRDVQVERILEKWSCADVNVAIASPSGLVIYPHLTILEDPRHLAHGRRYTPKERTGRVKDIVLRPLVESEKYTIEGKIGEFEVLQTNDPTRRRNEENIDYREAPIFMGENSQLSELYLCRRGSFDEFEWEWGSSDREVRARVREAGDDPDSYGPFEKWSGGGNGAIYRKIGTVPERMVLRMAIPTRESASRGPKQTNWRATLDIDTSKLEIRSYK